MHAAARLPPDEVSATRCTQGEQIDREGGESARKEAERAPCRCSVATTAAGYGGRFAQHNTNPPRPADGEQDTERGTEEARD